jgi:rhodanese-related sulfurtransferase
VNLLWGIVFAAGIIYMLWWFISPAFYLKQIQPEGINAEKYCVIDIRDYVLSNRTPMTEAENIPLSYLGRQIKERKVCDKDVVLVAEDRNAARIAARILSKKQKRKVYYITV